MTETEIALLAARLLGVSVALLLAPGFLLLAALHVDVEWPERTVLAFSLSYCWVLLLSIAIPMLEWNVDVAAILTVILLTGLSIVAFRRRLRHARGRHLDRRDLALAAVVVAAAAAAWIIEPSFTGEEALDLVSISRIADGGVISSTNTSLIPDTRSIYLFQPYQLALGIIARWAGVEPLVAFVKFRSVVVPLALIFLFSLVRRLTPSRWDALSVFVVMVIFIALDVQTWEMNSLFPLVRRGGVGAGLCVPAMLVLCLVATRKAFGPSLLRQVALCTAPVMLVASLSTHPLEMFTLLYFVVGMTTVILAGLDPQGDRKQALILTALLVAVAGTYVAVQSRLVPYVAEYEQEDKQTRRAELTRLASQPVAAIAGHSPAADLLSRSVPATTAIVFGLPALVVAALRAPTTAAVLAVGIVPLAVMYAIPAGFLVLTLLTSVETVRDVNAYFALLGLIALSVAVTTVAHTILNAAARQPEGFKRVVSTSLAISVAGLIVLATGRPAARALGASAMAQSGIVLATGVIAAIAALAVAWRTRKPFVSEAPFPQGVVALAACLAIPFAAPEVGIGGAFERREPVNLLTRLEAARSSPSVIEWPGYYEQLQGTIAPPLPVPRVVIDELRLRIPPRQIVLADPRYSCALVVLIDAYCINPASIYGHYFQPALGYFQKYVADRSSDSPEHPFFNATATLSEAERTLLQAYDVSFVLTDPESGDLMASKLNAVAESTALEMDLDGYRLYKVNAPVARSPAR